MNPLALLVAATVPALALLISVDPVTPTVVLVATAVLLTVLLPLVPSPQTLECAGSI